MKICLILVLFMLDFLCDALYDLHFYREKVRGMFHHAYDSYMQYAYPYDELRPLSCSGMQTWGNFSLTLIDTLDTLLVMKNETEFVKAANIILSTIDFDMDINVSVFETNIRVIGGLLGAHFLSGETKWGIQHGFPCKGPLLRMAKDLADRILPAFDTKTGMPYGTVNLRHGVPEGETDITCTASVTTFYLEFLCLSAFTGDPIYKTKAQKALESMWQHRSSIGLVGNHINVQTARWVAKEAGIGAGIDSYFEYLVKGAIFSRDPYLMAMFNEYEKVITKYMDYDGWKFWVNMDNGNIIWPIFQSLEAFWPGVLVLVGRLDEAKKSFSNYHRVWKKYGLMPEFFNVVKGTIHDSRSAYPLRPEFVESAYYLYQATGDNYYLRVGIEVLEAIEKLCRVDCGYAVIGDVADFRQEDRMESFFLAETLKYLYLLFDPQHTLNLAKFPEGRHLWPDPTMTGSGEGGVGESVDERGEGACIISTNGYIFNTEAHPFHISTVECCASQFKENGLGSSEASDEISPFQHTPENIGIDGIDGNNIGLAKPVGEFELEDLTNLMEGIYDSILSYDPDREVSVVTVPGLVNSTNDGNPKPSESRTPENLAFIPSQPSDPSEPPYFSAPRDVCDSKSHVVNSLGSPSSPNTRWFLLTSPALTRCFFQCHIYCCPIDPTNNAHRYTVSWQQSYQLLAPILTDTVAQGLSYKPSPSDLLCRAR